MKIGETICKSIINSSSIEGIDYAVNPYLGCSHGCVYCYARFMTRWYHKGEEWGTFVDVKTNAVECMKKEAYRKKNGVILFSSVTDAYQPIERKTQLTRNLLEVLQEYDPPIQILTKSSLIQRDVDVLEKFSQLEVGLTIISLDENVRKNFEPGASPVSERIETLKKFSELGISTYAFIGPLLPFVSEKDLEGLLNNLVDKVNRVIVDRLNIKAGNWVSIEKTVVENYPEIYDVFKEASETNSKYYGYLRNKIKLMLNDRSIPYDIVY